MIYCYLNKWRNHLLKYYLTLQKTQNCPRNNGRIGYHLYSHKTYSFNTYYRVFKAHPVGVLALLLCCSCMPRAPINPERKIGWSVRFISDKFREPVFGTSFFKGTIMKSGSSPLKLYLNIETVTHQSAQVQHQIQR